MAESKYQTTLRFSEHVSERLAHIAQTTKQSRTDQIEQALTLMWNGKTSLTFDTLSIIKRSYGSPGDSVRRHRGQFRASRFH